MRSMRLVVAFGALLAAPAVAQTVAGPQDLVARLARAAADKDLATIEASLAPGFVALACSTNPLKPCAPGAAKPIGARSAAAGARLRWALCCAGAAGDAPTRAEQDETLFALLGATLANAGLGPNPDDGSAICAPPPPAFDRKGAARLARVAGTEPENLRMAARAMALRATPDVAAPIAHTLAPGAVVALATDLTRDMGPGWTAVVTGKGSVSYANTPDLEELTPMALCFKKTGAGWTAAYLIQRVTP